MNGSPSCSGTGYQPKYSKCSKCLGPNDGNNSVEVDCNNNEIVRPTPCICFRPQHAYECGRCYQFFHGRLAEVCPQHKFDIFLMDFQCCPFCAAPTSMVQIAKFTWKQICKFESAELPGGDEGL